MPPAALAEVTEDQFTDAVAAELMPRPQAVAATTATADELMRRFITDMTLLRDLGLVVSLTYQALAVSIDQSEPIRNRPANCDDFVKVCFIYLWVSGRNIFFTFVGRRFVSPRPPGCRWTSW
jgi:hypothetical protein